MGSPIGVAPSIMINRMVHENGVPQAGHLLEVARLRGELMAAQAQNKTSPVPLTGPVEAPVNGAEVDLLI